MHKIEKINSIFQDKGKLSSATSFDFIAPVKKKSHNNLKISAPAGVLTFAFHSISLIELLDALNGGLI